MLHTSQARFCRVPILFMRQSSDRESLMSSFQSSEPHSWPENIAATSVKGSQKSYPSPASSSQDLHDCISPSQSSEAGSTLGPPVAARQITQAGDRGTKMSESGRQIPNPQSSHARSLSSGRPTSHPSRLPSSPTPQESSQHVSGSFPGSAPHLPTPPSPYDQRSNYIRPYMVSTPQVTLAIGHANPLFSFPQGYHAAGVHATPPEANVVTPLVHAVYQPMIQSQSPVYHHPPYTTERLSPQGSIPTSAPPSLYTVNPSPSSHSPGATQTPSRPPNATAPPYPGSQPFHSLRFPSPTQHSYTHTLPPQYTTRGYSQPYIQATEQEGQGHWWYLPVQYDPTLPSYLGQYPLVYHSAGHSDIDTPYGYSVHGLSPTGPSVPFPVLPGHPAEHSQDHHSDEPRSSLPLEANVTIPQTPTHERASSQNTEQKLVSDKRFIRRNYHPSPPSHRSEWVMWAGNVVPDATHDELWEFFNQPLPSPQGQTADDVITGGVVSIFLISRSSCAFVNFESEAHLNRAIERFDAQQLRPNDARCPRLVCRVRRKDDDLRAGVGAQRGIGMHMRWMKDQNDKGRSSQETETRVDSSSSRSYASTTSSLLTRHFPKRYFILKSLTQYDLDLSVQRSLWATQRHNEGILDQAYRTAGDVYLIFSGNRSGEFFGYARMAGPIVRSEEKIPWAARAGSPSPTPSLSTQGRTSMLAQAISEETPKTPAKGKHSPLLSPSEHRFVDESPTSLGESSVMPSMNLENPTLSWRGRAPASASAPAVLGPPHRNLSLGRSPVKSSSYSRNPADANVRSTAEETDITTQGVSVPQDLQGKSGLVGARGEGVVSSRKAEKQRRPDARDAKRLLASDAGADASEQAVKGTEVGGPREDNWGQPFKIQWLCTERLPFHRTRHLRNPWNNDREVKVSRDGTELEPTVGQKLLDEWQTPPDTRDAGNAEAGPSTGKLSYSAGSSRKGSGRSGWRSLPARRTGSTK